jgi:hypothetical protein
MYLWTITPVKRTATNARKSAPRVRKLRGANFRVSGND